MNDHNIYNMRICLIIINQKRIKMSSTNRKSISKSLTYIRC